MSPERKDKVPVERILKSRRVKMHETILNMLPGDGSLVRWEQLERETAARKIAKSTLSRHLKTAELRLEIERREIEGKGVFYRLLLEPWIPAYLKKEIALLSVTFDRLARGGELRPTPAELRSLLEWQVFALNDTLFKSFRKACQMRDATSAEAWVDLSTGYLFRRWLWTLGGILQMARPEGVRLLDEVYGTWVEELASVVKRHLDSESRPPGFAENLHRP